MIILDRPLNGGTQQVYKFNNGYGASVIRGGFMAYGGLELAVLKFKGDDWSLCYDTEITDDVIGYLDEEELTELLKRIEAL